MAQVDIGTTLKGYDFSGNPALTPSGFEYLGNQYCFIHQGGSTSPNSDGLIHAFKSTDDGATWTEQDTANAPFIGLNFSSGHTICRDNDLVYVIYIRISAGPTIDGVSVVIYNLSTDLWVLPAVDYFPLPHAGPNCPMLGFMVASQIQICLIRRGSGDMIFYFSGQQETVGGFDWPRVYYCTFDGTTFGTAVKLPDQATIADFFFPCAAASAGGIMHFSYTDGGTTGPGFNVWHIAMNSSGTFGVVELITDAGYLLHTSGTFSAPIIFTTSAGLEYIALAGLVNQDFTHAHQDQRLYYARTVSGIGAMTWHNSTISTGDYGDRSDPSLLFWDNFEIQPTPISVAFENDIVMVAWMTTDFSGDGFTYQSQAKVPLFVWTTKAIVITTSIPVFSAVQLSTWAMPTNTKIGVLAFSVGTSSPTTDQEVCPFNALVPFVPVSSGNRSRSYYQ